MHWFIFAISSPILLTLANQIDKHLIEEYFKGGGIGAMMIFSSLAGLLLFPLAFCFAGQKILCVAPYDAMALVGVGILSALAVFCYLLALEEGETSVIVPFYQSVPIFGLILAFLFLGEKIDILHLVSIPIIVTGSLILSFEIDADSGNRFKIRPIALILTSSLLFAINSIIFKKLALEYGFWESIFYEYVGLFCVGCILFSVTKNYRQQFIKVFKENRRKVLLFNISNEILVLCGNLCVEYALILGPVALVLLADSYQPIFVLIWGLVFARFFPEMSYDNFSKKHLVKKVIGIAIIFIGSVAINIPSAR